MTPNIVAFIRARLAEDERMALAACERGSAGRWRQEDPNREPGRIYDDLNDIVTYDEGSPSEAQARHIAGHDPARALRGVEAKRRILAQHGAEWQEGVGHRCAVVVHDDTLTFYGRSCPTLRALAAEWSDHEQYDEEWLF
jgi:hypothetical protein